MLASRLARHTGFSDQVDRAVAFAGRELAITYLVRNQREKAMTTLIEAAEQSSRPEVFADETVVLPELRPLHDHPGWATIERARRLSQPSAP